LEQLQNSVKSTKNVKAKRKRNPNPPAPAPEDKFQSVLTIIPFVDRETIETNVEKIPKIIFRSLSPYKVEKQ
jgi:hypothetical protein